MRLVATSLPYVPFLAFQPRARNKVFCPAPHRHRSYRLLPIILSSPEPQARPKPRICPHNSGPTPQNRQNLQKAQCNILLAARLNSFIAERGNWTLKVTPCPREKFSTSSVRWISVEQNVTSALFHHGSNGWDGSQLSIVLRDAESKAQKSKRAE